MAATAITNPGIMQANQAYDFTIDVSNNGTEAPNAYTVKLMSIDERTELASLTVTTPLDPGDTAQHTLSWTPVVGGVYNVYGQVVLAGDGNAANDASPTTELYILDATMTVISVGDDETTTSGYNLPLSMNYKNSVSEELYFTDETHLASGTISAIVYKNNFLNDLADKSVKIWMAHTTVTDLSGGWLPAVDYTLVFDGTVDFPSGVNNIVIPLDTPFSYTGGTLATRVNRPMDTESHSYSDKFFYTTNPDHSTRSRYLNSSNTTYDPMAPSATGYTLNYFPNTMFVVQNAVMEPAAILEGHVYMADGSTPIVGATVTVDETITTTTDIDGFYSFTFWEGLTFDVTASAPDFYSSTQSDVALTLGDTTTQDFSLTHLPLITVSGMVTSNDYPAGLEGATVELFGYDNYEALTGPGGVFSIANVIGSSETIAYTWEVSKEGYAAQSGSFDAIESDVNLGTINLTEYLWTPYNLVASHEGANAGLIWQAAGVPDYYFADFEDDDGGWIGSGYGDWEWSDAYDVNSFVYDNTGADVTAPTAAYSGTGMWATKMLTNHSNSGAFSYLSQTIDLSPFDNPRLSFWSWENVFGSYDYCQVAINGTLIWGPSWDYTGTTWQQRVIDLSAYDGQTVEIQFQFYASTVVNYAGWYIDDVYVGPAADRKNVSQTLGSRSLDCIGL